MPKGDVFVRRLRRAVSVGRKKGALERDLSLLEEAANFIEGRRVPRLGQNQIDMLRDLRVEGNAKWGTRHQSAMVRTLKSLVFHGLVRWEPPGGVSLGLGRYSITKRGRRVLAECYIATPEGR